MFDRFQKEKSDFLKKKDKSRKGSIDKDAVKIVESINSKKDHYTTSSCAGRIVLIENTTKKKIDARWIFKKHDKVKLNEMLKALNDYQQKNKDKSRNEVWLKQEPIILHVACRNLEAAKKMLEAARKIFKRAGIISLNDKKIVIEIIGSERIETIIADKKFVADEKYIKHLIKYANKNFEENKKKSDRFLEEIKEC